MLPDKKYAPFTIKRYTHWTLFLHMQQLPYLGRCYAWWNDTEPGEGEGMEVSDLSGDALKELFWDIPADLKAGLKMLGYPVDKYGKDFLLNTCYLANEPAHNHHMHWHFIPRIRTQLVCPALPFNGSDSNWETNYVPYDKSCNLHPDLIPKVRLLMARAIDGAVV